MIRQPFANLSERAGRVHLRLRRVVRARLEGREPGRRPCGPRGPLLLLLLGGPGGVVLLHHLGRRLRLLLLLLGPARLVRRVERGRLVDVERAQRAVQVVDVGVGVRGLLEKDFFI